MSNTYSHPIYTGAASFLEAIARDDVERLPEMIVAAALYEEDREVLERALIELSRHSNATIRGNATLGFGHVARIFGVVCSDAAEIVVRGLADASSYVRGHAHSAADDLQMFAGISDLRSPCAEPRLLNGRRSRDRSSRSSGSVRGPDVTDSPRGLRAIEISKYSLSALRSGSYLTSDWTSCSDIAKRVGLTREQYLATEATYVATTLRFVAVLGGDPVRANGIEFWNDQDAELARHGLHDVFDGSDPPAEGEPIAPHRVENVIKRCLREVAWMELAHPFDLLIHFGHDLRLVIVTSLDVDRAIEDAVAMGLHVHDRSLRLPTIDGWRRLRGE